METIQAINSRRSIRKYTSQKISDELIKKLLTAGMQAPSARNYQPWHFVITNDREILDQIPKLHPYADMMYQATLAILVCGDLKIEKSVEYISLDCSAATQNILLAAHALDLGAVWLGVYPRKDRMKGLKKLFKTPENIIPVSLISCGYPAEKIPPENRYNQSKIHFNYF